MDDMYREVILDHYRNPRNRGLVQNADVHARDTNVMCGDVIEITALVNGGRLAEVRFEGRGCAISQASASMLTELVEGRSLEEVAKMQKQELLDTLGIPLSPSRLKCALLPLKVLKLGVYSYMGRKMAEEEKDELDVV